ncbi:rab11 family-interacting protein 1-like isoform X2 [Eleutherodactylus coqui]|uniref:rab11 family-interacting protein 1-like isoform X2 n=1 Tax=Eleutherodactylus coqui TaxID=57060 RepID=UPI003462BE49
MSWSWYKLHSKSGKKEKERGEIQVSIQFTRNNLTASMFDLSIKDKPKTPFGKLKDKLKVKKLSQMESSSAIVPSSIGRLDSDDEDEKKPKSKAAAFFKGRLRKSSLTRSNTSLGSDSTVSSTSGTVPTGAGVSIVLPDVVKKPASRNSSLSAEPTVKDHEASPRMTHKRAFSDEVSQLKLFPEPKSVQNLKPKGSPISRSSVCINGSHVYTEVPAPKPVTSLEKSSPASKSFQNIVKKAEEVTEVIRGPSLGSEKPEHKTGPATEEQSTSSKPTPQPKPTIDPVRVETKPVQITTPMVFSEEESKNKSHEVKTKEEKPKTGFHHGPGKNDPGNKSLAESKPHVPATTEERGKVGSWFGSKDTKEAHQKPSFPSGSIATSEAAERGSSLVEEHSPLVSSCSTEDLNVYLYQGESGNFDDRPEFRPTQISSSEPRMVLGWEQQFDALASSRLQPASSNYQQSPEPEDHNVSREPLFFPFNKPETITNMFIARQKEDEWHNLQANNSNLDLCWPESFNSDAKKSPLPSSLLPNLSPTSPPSPGSTGLKSFVNLSTNAFNDPKSFNHASQCVDTPDPASSEGRVATVQPIVLTEQNMVKIGEVMSQDSLILTKDSVAPISNHALESSSDVHNLQVSKEFVGQVSTKCNLDRIDVEWDILHKQTVGDIIKEQAISVDVGSVAPPKPPRLRLSGCIEQIEDEDDSYKQTSHQDAIAKQIQNPEEHMEEQNMGGSTQAVSLVTFCPAIEIRSPVLGAFTKDTQSTTEGRMTALREEDNSGAVNGEHLLDVGEVTASEQFKTCLSNVSLDTDLSRRHEASDKLELINHGQSKPLNILGGSKQSSDDFYFKKQMPVSKLQKGNWSELSTQSKKVEQSDVLYWSAVEEQMPKCVIEPGTHEYVPTSQCNSASADGRNESSLSYEQKPEPDQNKPEDVVLELASPPSNELESNAKALRHESQHGYSLRQLSSWSTDIIVDFKNEDFWRTEFDQSDQNHSQSLPSPGNPFSPVDPTPLSHKNPFILEHSQSSQSSESSLQEESSFKDLHASAALRNFPSAVLPTDVKTPNLHGSQPLAFSTPSLAAVPNIKPSNFPSLITLLTTPGTTTATNTHTATLSGLHSSVAGGVTTAAPPILPLETQTADNPFIPLKISPHPVKPISATLSEPTPEKNMQRPAITTALSSGLEMLKSVTGVTSATPKKPEPERLKDLCLPDQAAKYYHLTHDELIHMLLQREAELCRRDSHVRELEDYIDKLLVRIMEQAPALLQAPLETKE